MVAAARAKAAAADVPIDFPRRRPGPARALHAARPDGGRLVLVEGRWSTGAGLTADECASVVGNVRKEVSVTRLDDAALWGHPIDDERYLLVSRS
jgi:hypothetical protein